MQRPQLALIRLIFKKKIQRASIVYKLRLVFKKGAVAGLSAWARKALCAAGGSEPR